MDSSHSRLHYEGFQFHRLKYFQVDGGFDIMWFIASYLMYVNCTVNPLIYGFTNTRFRRAMDRTPGVACFKFGTWCCACITVRFENFTPSVVSSQSSVIIPDSK